MWGSSDLIWVSADLTGSEGHFIRQTVSFHLVNAVPRLAGPTYRWHWRYVCAQGGLNVTGQSPITPRARNRTLRAPEAKCLCLYRLPAGRSRDAVAARWR